MCSRNALDAVSNPAVERRMLAQLTEYCNAAEISKHSAKIIHLRASFPACNEHRSTTPGRTETSTRPAKQLSGCGHCCPGPRRRKTSTRFSVTAVAPSCLPTMQCFATTIHSRKGEGAPMSLIVPANETGCGLHGCRLRSRKRSGRGCHGHVRTRRHQYGHSSPGLHGGFGADCRHLRPGADQLLSAPMRSRKRRYRQSWVPSPNTSSW